MYYYSRKKFTLQLSVLIKLSNLSSFALQKGTINMTPATPNSVSSNIVFIFSKEIDKVIDISVVIITLIAFIDKSSIQSDCSISYYHIYWLLSACACISTGRKYVLNKDTCLTNIVCG